MRRLVLISRLAGLVVALALGVGSAFIHRADLTSQASISQMATVAVGLGAFVVLSTLTRIGHARVLERSLTEVGHLTEQLRALAERDPLTGLYNMRSFYDALSVAIDQARTAGGGVSVIVADLDNFKMLNDSFGHQYGDRVLIAAAAVFARAGAREATAARLGGDEFALLLPGVSRAEAVEAARSIEEALRGVQVDDRQPAMLGSFGIGAFPDDGGTAQLLFAAADSRMYGEKHRRKARPIAGASHATWRLFVRAGRALGSGVTPPEILRDIADAALREFALTACIIKIGASSPAVIAAEDPVVAVALGRLAVRDRLDAAAIAAEMPAEAWLVGQPTTGDSDAGGLLMLVGQPPGSFRPDASVVVALSELVHTVANGATVATVDHENLAQAA